MATSEHIQTRRMLRSMESRRDFEELLELCTLSDADKEILRRHYIQDQNFQLIGDLLGYSETTIKTRHREALRKIAALRRRADP